MTQPIRTTPDDAEDDAACLVGFAPSLARPLGQERRTAILAELIATVALATATLLVVTVVSFGVAKADRPAAAPTSFALRF
jgi:hypothetical protein